jgi:hypothetical protein
MRKLLLGLAVLSGLAAAVPASAAEFRHIDAPRGPIVEAYWVHHHWVPPHRWHHRWEHGHFRR